jgi:hypothetical protein
MGNAKRDQAVISYLKTAKTVDTLRLLLAVLIGRVEEGTWNSRVREEGTGVDPPPSLRSCLLDGTRKRYVR